MSNRTHYLADYQAPAFSVQQLHLDIDLDADSSVVKSELICRRETQGDFILDGDAETLQLLGIWMNDKPVSPTDYTLNAKSLHLHQVPEEAFSLRIHTQINPRSNTKLMGLFLSNQRLFTQCEAEGFRRITYYFDRPDVLTVFSVRLSADKQLYPQLLSNGNLIDSGDLANNRHFAQWHDPFPKPCYLFALVAGEFACLQDTFTTQSGRTINLAIYVEPQQLNQCQHAMQAVKDAMAWDERVFKLEYDLDCYMIVAVSDFNAGAMENKGLNIFNTKFVLADTQTATDDDFDGIASVIAHEYFHNWTGNRVTCRDWFQLSLKEGLTVFRDQEFSADMASRAVKRIEDVRYLRAAQFAEDAGALAHPVRPSSYQEISNFYTLTIYEKGAELIRMQHTLLGQKAFHQGMDLYFARHDGQAVTTDDFVAAMQDASGKNLQIFKRWYDYAGTPEVQVKGYYDTNQQTYTLDFTQHCRDSAEAQNKLPLHIPILIGLLDAQTGKAIRISSEKTAQTSVLFELTEASQRLILQDIPSAPTPSLLRQFSAPVHLHFDYSNTELAFLFAHDTDHFNRWEAGQRLMKNLLRQAASTQEWAIFAPLSQAFQSIMNDSCLDPAFQALALTLPSLNECWDALHPLPLTQIIQARQACLAQLSQTLHPMWQAHYQRASQALLSPDLTAPAWRSLRNVCLSYLTQLDDITACTLAAQQFSEAENMTDRMGALRALNDCQSHAAQTLRTNCLNRFYQDWQHEALVVDKWLALQASRQHADTLSTIQTLLQHPAFILTNPNKVRNLIGVFSQNQFALQQPDGRGFAFLAEKIIELDRINPQIAARLCNIFSRMPQLEQTQAEFARQALQHILQQAQSSDVQEIAQKNLSL